MSFWKQDVLIFGRILTQYSFKVVLLQNTDLQFKKVKLVNSHWLKGCHILGLHGTSFSGLKVNRLHYLSFSGLKVNCHII